MMDYEALLTSAQPLHDAIGSDNDLAALFYTGSTPGAPRA